MKSADYFCSNSTERQTDSIDCTTACRGEENLQSTEQQANSPQEMYRVGQKTGLMTQRCVIHNLHVNAVKYPLPNLHKLSIPRKLHWIYDKKSSASCLTKYHDFHDWNLHEKCDKNLSATVWPRKRTFRNKRFDWNPWTRTDNTGLKSQLTSMFARSMEQFAIIVVRQFPPRLSRRTDVIIELRYGMCWRRLSDNAIITWTTTTQPTNGRLCEAIRTSRYQNSH